VASVPENGVRPGDSADTIPNSGSSGIPVLGGGGLAFGAFHQWQGKEGSGRRPATAERRIVTAGAKAKDPSAEAAQGWWPPKPDGPSLWIDRSSFVPGGTYWVPKREISRLGSLFRPPGFLSF